MVYGYQEYQDQVVQNSNSGYYWMGVIRNGQLYILGYRKSMIEAETYLNDYAPGEQHVIERFNSKNIHRVSGKFKSKALERYKSLDVALRKNILSQSEQIRNKRFNNQEAVGYNEYKKEVKKRKKPLVPDMFEGQKEEY